MDNSGEKPASQTFERLHIELRRLEWAKELSEDTLTAITNAADLVEFRAGEVVIDVESEITHVYFLITGGMQATLYDLLGKEIQKDTFARGAVIGLFSVGSSDRSHMQFQVTEPSTAIRLTQSNLLQLTAKHAEFQLAMFRMSANVFIQYVMVD
jgi:CRP-like cAMP-binding protein